MTEANLQPASYPWTPGELDVWRMREQLAVSEFAQKYRRVNLGSHQGAWDNSVTPYLVQIMDTANLPYVHELVVCGPEQSGKTNSVLNILLYNLWARPGNIKYVMLPKEGLAKKFSRDRFIPTLTSCAPLAARLSDNPDDLAAGRIALRDGTIIYPIWGTSASEISSFPSDCTLADEIDKNDDLTGDESDPLKLLEKRSRTYRRYLNMKCSTPTLETGHIWRALLACAQVYDRHAACPHCGEHQQMEEKYLTWPGQPDLLQSEICNLRSGSSADGATTQQPHADPETVKSNRSARYICPHCGGLWDDIDRNRAVRNGKWVGRHQVDRPRSVGYHISGFICPDISLSDLAAAILRARSGDESAEKERDNSYFGIPHRRKAAGARKEDLILALRDDRPRGLVPKDIAALILCADTQQRGFWYEVRAVGWGQTLESWQVREGYVESWEALRRIAYDDDHLDIDGQRHVIRIALIDSGGGTGTTPKHSRTAEVYEFCRLNPLFRPIKGRQTMTKPWGTTRLDHYPGKNGKAIPIPGGLDLYTINVTHFKDQLATKLAVLPGDPGTWNLHAEATEDYARQMCVEHRDERGHYQCPRGKDNHMWDCYSDDTEVLTDTGWKYFAELNYSNRLATVNLATDEIEYQRPQHLIAREYAGEMISIVGKRIDLCVTPTHRMVTYRKIFRGGRWKFDVAPEITLAKNLDIWHRIKLTGLWRGEISPKTVTLPATHGLLGRPLQPEVAIDAGDWAEFLGWYVAEGHRFCYEHPSQPKSIKRRVCITQINEAGRAKLEHLLNRLPVKWHLSSGKHYTITSRQIYDAVAECGDGAENKRVPTWINRSDTTIIARFLEGAIAGDGWYEPSGKARYATISRTLADDIQELFVKMGLSPNITIRGKKQLHHRNQYWITANTTKTASLRDGRNKSLISKKPYSGNVYCATVPNGTLIVRRNGKVAICGNCAVYFLAACEVLQVKYWQKEGGVTPQRRVISQGVRNNG